MKKYQTSGILKMINLKSLTLKNFKLFDSNPYTLNFDGSNLVLLDGPNGYGKTSVFDAIELGLTGNLSRLIPLENKQNPNDIVVAHNDSNDVEITIELIDLDGNTRVFKRKLKKTITNSSRKISKFAELWELYEIIGEESFPVTEDILTSHLKSSDFARDYLLFHYVQQEETSRFLKNNTEVQRAEELARLFGDTRKSEEELKKLSLALSKLSLKHKEHKLKIDKIKALYKIDSNTSSLIGNSEPHFHLLPWLADTYKSPFWDVSSIPELNEIKLTSILDELNSLRELVRFRDFFIRNRSVENASNQRNLIRLYVIYYRAIPSYEEIIEKNKNHDLVTSAYKILVTQELNDIKKDIDINLLFSILSLQNQDNFVSDLNILIEENNNNKGLNSLFSEIIKHHGLMSNDIAKLPDQSSCLLCGCDYHTHLSLNQAITENGLLLRSHLSENEKKLFKMRDKFHQIHLKPLTQLCLDYIQKQIVFSNEELTDLITANSSKDRMVKMQEWFDSEGISYDDLLVQDYPVSHDKLYLESLVQELVERIQSLVKVVPDDFVEANKEGVFERLYLDYFNRSHESLAKIDPILIEKKQNYIKSLHFLSINEVVEELKNLEYRNTVIKKAMDDIGEISDTIKVQIRKYRKKLITDIEIPFYLYSGKILQTHQAGIGKGIFIKDQTGDDELRNVRFVSNWGSDHDVLNTMSSGQISAIVIALTLALNKVYCKNFSCILIDDPVQTMDDINMTSLIELLRNDFKGRKLIISTHEDKVSRFFTYKYLKHGNQVKIINVMQRTEHYPSNNYIYRKAIPVVRK